MEIKFSNYGQKRNINCTDGELKIFEQICTLSGADDIVLERKSDSYVTASIGPTDVARFKYTDRAKWILLPYVQNDKIRISTTDISPLSSQLKEAVEIARKING